jgi:hypothetical protein
MREFLPFERVPPEKCYGLRLKHRYNTGDITANHLLPWGFTRDVNEFLLD